MCSVLNVYLFYIGDASASRTTEESEIDKRVEEALEMEDPEIFLDLRHTNENKEDRYGVFWTQCKVYLDECTAVHERRHESVTYMARAMSVRDLVEQVSKTCPEGTPVPSQQWVRLQFWPKNPRTKAAAQFRKKLPVKMMIQKRQFRINHVDGHYCATIFMYIREYAVLFRDSSVFVCLGDKHRVKVGEPGTPVAAVERGKQVLVSMSQSFQGVIMILPGLALYSQCF